MPHGQRLLSRFAGGLVASLLSGFLMNSQWGHASDPSAHPTPASLEMMQLVSDEHGSVADMVKAQLANERTELPRKTTVSSTDLDPASTATAQQHGDRRSPTARSRKTS
jgi:hypothetical protein